MSTPSSAAGPATAGTYVGLFSVALSTLMLEILLTRIFSVTMWYHFAFLAVSVAMFGMTVGALFVYLAPNRLPPERTKAHLGRFALLFALATVISIVALLNIRFTERASLAGLSSMAGTYLVASVPFFFSGVSVTLVLTRFVPRVGSLYAADLVGAALGCLLLVWLLDATDGPSTVLLSGMFAALGALAFAMDSGERRVQLAAAGTAVAMLVGALANTAQGEQGSPLLRLAWVKGRLEDRLLFEKWNSYSRIAVAGDPDEWVEPFGWGIPPARTQAWRTRQLRLNIDASASTELTAFDGDTSAVAYLRDDLSNLAHWLRHDAKVLVVGSGGGRDVLSALVFDQAEVTAVEVNQAILSAVNGVFGPFTGHLDRNERVRFVNDEARSYLARQQDRFDIVQISLIDTWAATAAGAFALTENTLYTVEAWRTFLDRLSDQGIFTVTRWYEAGVPVEAYRMVALANRALRDKGVAAPRNHLVLVRYEPPPTESGPVAGVAGLLLKRSPFTADELATLDAVVARLGFEVILSPGVAWDPWVERLASAEDVDEVAREYPFDVSAPTDDRPFFFHVLRLRDFFRRDLWKIGRTSFNAKAVGVLGSLSVVVLALTGLCLLVPLWLSAGLSAGSLPLFAYFGAIGTGFMLLEIGMMQRLIVMLGHPTYALSVVLFTLLLASGVGSSLSGRLPIVRSPRGGLALCGAIVAVTGVVALVLPGIAAALEPASTPARIATAVAVLLPMGLLMGMAFPTGMRIASRADATLTPWLWGINGATSVCASVLAIVVAMSAGFTATLWAGAAAYAIAAVSIAFAGRATR